MGSHGSYTEPEPARRPQLPWWQVNIPPRERETECPEPLRNLSAKDRKIIGTRNEDYRLQTWDEVVDLVRTGRLGDFRRWPSDLRRYREYIWWLNREYGSVMRFMLQERLHWPEPVVPRGSKPFGDKQDFRILMNDWPYGLDDRIVHLVVWTKFDLRDDAETEAEIDRFVAQTFSAGVAKDKFVWFKNPPVLKSIHSVEHIHVMLLDPDPDFVRKITGGDVPRSQLLKGAKGCPG